MSVVGFDDSPLASRVRPALTTISQDVVVRRSIAPTPEAAGLAVDADRAI